MTDPLHQHRAQLPTPRRRWAAPCMVSASLAPSPVLLCSSGTPFSCAPTPLGACCDVDPDCNTLCQGG